MKLTRRELAAALTAGTALAQTPSQPPVTAEEALRAARDQQKAATTRLASQTVPMTTEPAFQFKA